MMLAGLGSKVRFANDDTEFTIVKIEKSGVTLKSETETIQFRLKEFEALYV